MSAREAYLEARVGELHDEIGRLRAERSQYLDLLGQIWIYVHWRYVTRQLTTEQKTLWADAVDASGDPEDRGLTVDRWWLEVGND